MPAPAPEPAPRPTHRPTLRPTPSPVPPANGDWDKDENGNVYLVLYPLGMVMEKRGGNDRDYIDSNDSGGGITADGLADVTFPHLYYFMNGSDGYSSFQSLSVNVATATETRSGMTTVTGSLTSKVEFKVNG